MRFFPIYSEEPDAEASPGLTPLLLNLLPVFRSMPTALIAGKLGSAPSGNLALRLDDLACGARPLFAISAGRLFLTSISMVGKRFGRAIAAILFMVVLNAVLIVGPFRNLVVIDVTLFISVYMLVSISAMRLRVREPDLKRLVRVPFGAAGMVALVIPALLILRLTTYVNAIDHGAVLLGFEGSDPSGADAA